MSSWGTIWRNESISLLNKFKWHLLKHGIFCYDPQEQALINLIQGIDLGGDRNAKILLNHNLTCLF